jgi:hypothetical protein
MIAGGQQCYGGRPDQVRVLSPHLEVSPRRHRSVVCSPQNLRLHKAFGDPHFIDVVEEINEAARLKDLSATEPILITTNGIILSGFGRWRLAVLEGRKEVQCIEYPIGEDDAIEFILSHCKPRRGWNAFVRIQLALTLEPTFQRRALDHMRAGGRYKGSSKLTEATRLDVRSKIAAAAGVSVGNVTKVKQLTTTAHSDLLQALRSGEISIHRGWRWSKAPLEKQQEELHCYQSQRGVRKTIRLLLSQHRSKGLPVVPDLGSLARQLASLEPKLGVVTVGVIKAPGRAVFLTEELVRALG